MPEAVLCCYEYPQRCCPYVAPESHKLTRAPSKWPMGECQRQLPASIPLSLFITAPLSFLQPVKTKVTILGKKRNTEIVGQLYGVLVMRRKEGQEAKKLGSVTHQRKTVCLTTLEQLSQHSCALVQLQSSVAESQQHCGKEAAWHRG